MSIATVASASSNNSTVEALAKLQFQEKRALSATGSIPEKSPTPSSMSNFSPKASLAKASVGIKDSVAASVATGVVSECVTNLQKNNFQEDPLAAWFINRDVWKYIPIISKTCNGKIPAEMDAQACENAFSLGALPAILYAAHSNDDTFNRYKQTIIGAVVHDVEQHNKQVAKEQQYIVADPVIESFLNSLVSVADRAMNGSCCVML